ncbi:uncharacterized protein LOC105766997 [Gossypium raimondii]|uniref:uncharacterized protein LOC105766997 n=1 Tax=Gossypium raimondii TaxID=29730 RepID=UPI00063A948F|nr:uncharacterized protein LOC105766997 [Gossypium raimondii]
MVWKLQTLPKIRIFCWRIGHDILLTYEKISNIRRDFNSDCLRCGRDKETLIHALKDYLRARAVLMHGGLNSKLLDGSHCRGVDWIKKVARSLDLKALSDFITVLWNIWNNRKNKVFWNMEEDAKVTWEKAAALSQDFRIFNLLHEPSLPKPAVNKGWRKPNQGMVKINFDAVVKDRKTSFGIIARDHDGFVLGRRPGVLNRNYNAEWAELYALEESIKLARDNTWVRFEFESDCASLYICPSLRILLSLFVQDSYTGLDSSLMVGSYQIAVNCGDNSECHLELTYAATLRISVNCGDNSRRNL